MAAIDIARPRQDEDALDVYRSIYEEISTAFARGTMFRRWLGYGDADFDAVADVVEHFHLGPMLQIERMERGLNFLLDFDHLPKLEIVENLVANRRTRDFPLLQAQAERAAGRIQRDASRLDKSIALLDQAGALPYAARVRCERALLTGDDGEMQAGLAVLERIGDAQQIGRFERLQVG